CNEEPTVKNANDAVEFLNELQIFIDALADMAVDKTVENLPGQLDHGRDVFPDGTLFVEGPDEVPHHLLYLAPPVVLQVNQSRFQMAPDALDVLLGGLAKIFRVLLDERFGLSRDLIDQSFERLLAFLNEFFGACCNQLFEAFQESTEFLEEFA